MFYKSTHATMNLLPHLHDGNIQVPNEFRSCSVSFLNVCVCLCVFFQLKSRWFVIRCVRRQGAGVLVQNSVSHANTSAEEGHVSSPVTYIMGEYVCKQIICGGTLLMYTAFQVFFSF